MVEATRGWSSDFVTFGTTSSAKIIDRLRHTYPVASESEYRSWGNTVPILQQATGKLVRTDNDYKHCTVVLEYELPMESRRPDAVLLLRHSIIVIEFKGKSAPSDADVDQVHAYARDLRCYHKECHKRPVHAVLVLTRAHGYNKGTRGREHLWTRRARYSSQPPRYATD